jgi:hypothetical protein
MSREHDALWDENDFPMPRVVLPRAHTGATIRWDANDEPEVPLDHDLVDEGRRALAQYRALYAEAKRERDAFNVAITRLYLEGHRKGDLARLFGCSERAANRAIHDGRDWINALAKEAGRRSISLSNQDFDVVHGELHKMALGRTDQYAPEAFE